MNVQTICHVVYNDLRGNFTELFNKQKNFPSFQGTVRQISISVSHTDVIRGMHCSPYVKLVKCLTGKLYDVTVDLRPESTNYKKIYSQWLEENDNKMILIPDGVAHGFYSAKDNTIIQYIQWGPYEKKLEIEVNCFDPSLAITWPRPITGRYILSDKDTYNPYLDIALKNRPLTEFMILGSSGFLGQEVVNIMIEAKCNFYCSFVRLENYEQIKEELDRIRPKYVICAAGISGRPNTDWCETNRAETIMTNVVGQLNIVDACRLMNIHCTLFGTGMLYKHKNEKQRFTELDPSNAEESFYVRQRVLLEKMLESFDNVLNLRIVFPASSSLHERSIIGKLLNYKKIISIETSFTIIDDLFPLLIEMCRMGLRGTYNFSNPGTTTNGVIMQMYKKIVQPNYFLQESEEIFSTNIKPHAELDVTKLLQIFPHIPHVLVGLEKMLLKIACNQ
jgi:3,5-epimerase/4-reductase